MYGILLNHESPRRGLNFVTAKIIKGALEIKYGEKNIELGYLDIRDCGHAKDYVKAMWMMLQRKSQMILLLQLVKQNL